MATFEYRALQPDGVTAEGAIEAASRQEAIRRLEGRGLTPLKLAEASGASQGTARTSTKSTPKGSGDPEAARPSLLNLKLRLGSDRVPFKALENFTRQLSSLLAAGVPLARSLHILCRESSSPAARLKWKEVHDLVIDGMPLAEAMARSPETFPHIYVAMVQAGETGGFLDVVLGQIAEFQTREKELRARVRAAMIYPAVLLTLVIGVVIFLLVFFIPRFQTIFAGFGAALPLLTQIVVGISKLAVHYGPFVLAGVGAGIYALRRWMASDAGRRAWQLFVLRLPLVGMLSARFAMTRFCRMLGTLVNAGVPLIQALRVARESIGNQTLIDAVTHSIERVQQGESLAASLADCPMLFPGSVIEMISVGEETGKMDKELVRLATETDNELDQQLRTAVSLAEPLLLFLMAGIIGVIFVGMVLPIFSIQDYIK